MSKKEAEQAEWPDKVKHKLHLEQGIRFCKVEDAPECLAGSLYVPAHSLNKNHAAFYFIIEKDKIIFIDDSGTVLENLKKIEETQVWEEPGTGVVFADFLELLIKGDAVYITELEGQLEKLEDSVLEKGLEDNFNHIISSYRRKIMVFSHYYLQLSDVGSVLQEDDNHFFNEKEQRSFELFVERVNRLREETQMLREYSIQIREVYQSRIDERQNDIMRTLTVVTTIFLPLSLIAGWYGMNFRYMPELEWQYGYAGIIGISVLIVILCIWLFRKKKFW
ncbi:MAG: CorA family divalent cation transporter [Eubacteriales bacterium]|nr:CorA family divalent cation transporter [Eubacteriales bacterium]